MEKKMGDDLFTSFDLTGGQDGVVVVPGARDVQIIACSDGVLGTASQNILNRPHVATDRELRILSMADTVSGTWFAEESDYLKTPVPARNTTPYSHTQLRILTFLKEHNY